VPSSAPSVLVVEDDPDIRETLSEVLSAEGYDVTAAANGREALDKLGVMHRPCMILLDLMMPVMNGWEFLRAIEQSADLSSIPVTVVSAAGHGVPIGGTRFIRKPIDLDLLLEHVRQVCAAGAA
jgi:CheY-like chemotaxis protein